MSKPKVLLVLEGFQDIRYVYGLAEICDLTLLTPQGTYRGNGLKARMAEAKLNIPVVEIPGGRFQYQFRSLLKLFQIARNFDIILTQEILRGCLSAAVAGRLFGVPVLSTIHLPYREYFRCRRRRDQIGWLRDKIGQLTIESLVRINGKLVTEFLPLGDYLYERYKRYTRKSSICWYYGVDTKIFRPASVSKSELRKRLSLPENDFLIFFSSRISHEKDPQSVLKAFAKLSQMGVKATLVNLSGGFEDFKALAETYMDNPRVIAREAEHPMKGGLAEYYQASDVCVQSSLEEGLGYSPLEALACGTPVIATDVGGLRWLHNHAEMVPPGDSEAVLKALLKIHHSPKSVQEQTERGRKLVQSRCSREIAFESIATVFSRYTPNRIKKAA